MGKINVLYLVSTLDAGGSEWTLYMLAKGLDKVRFNPIVAYFFWGGVLEDLLKQKGIEVVCVGPNKANISKWDRLRSIIKLAGFLRKRKIGIVHTFQFDVDILGAVAAKLAGVPVVIAHIAGESYLTWFQKYKWRYKVISKFFIDKYIVCSKFLTDKFISSCNVNGTKVLTIQNCVDEKRFHFRYGKDENNLRKELGLGNDEIVIGCIANFCPDKGHRYLIDAIPKVAPLFPNLKVILMGRFAPLKDELIEQAKVLGVSDKVIFLDFHLNIEGILGLMDIFVLPSLGEGLPVAVLEAMYMAKPVVATKIDGIPEAVVEGETGILVPSRNSDALAKAIVSVLADRNKAREMGRRGREKCLEEFSSSVLIMKTEGLYGSLLNEKGVKCIRASMKKITVVQAVENLRIGGIEKMVSTIAQGLNKDKYDVKVYCLAEGGAIADELIRNGYDVKILNLKTYHNPVNIIKLADLMRKDRVDILHTHGYFASTFARLAAIIAGVPIIFTKISSTYYELKLKHRLTERVLSLFSDRIICVSDAVKEFVVRAEGIDPGKITVIRNGGAIKPVSRPKVTLRSVWGIKEGDKVIGTVARLEPVKGIEYLIKAAAKVVNAIDDVKLLIVGDGTQRQELGNLAKELRISDKVIFAGFLTNHQDALSIMDIFVLPSSTREGFSSALTEAMGFGLPVIATRIGGNVEAISDGINGVLVPPKDPDAMAEAIISLLKDPSRAKNMAGESKKLYCEKFSAGIMVKKIEELYDLFIGKKLKTKTKYRVIFFPEGDMTNPASRYNCYHLAGTLSGEGIRTYISHSVFPYGRPLNYVREKYLLVKNLLKKSLVILTSKKGDIIFIQRGIQWRGFFDKVLFQLYLFTKRALKRKIIFHFDDAIYLYLPEYAARTMIEISDAVIVGSHHLRDYASKFSKNVFLIPTSIDTDKWKPGPNQVRDKNSFCIGWCGTSSNLEYLNLLREPLSVLGRKFNIELKIIGPESEAENLPEFENIKVVYQPWNLNNEIEAISKFDIGTMPLYDGEAERGKCGLKLLLYMSLGIPAIGSAVGENRYIIRDGENGFLASNEKEWVEKLEALITDKDLRERFSLEGRRTVLERYSLKDSAEKLAQIIRGLNIE